MRYLQSDCLDAELHERLAQPGSSEGPAFDLITMISQDFSDLATSEGLSLEASQNGGFFSPERHHVITARFVYPQEIVSVEKYTIIEARPAPTVRRSSQPLRDLQV